MNTQQQDVLRRFLFEELGVRGLWVRLSKSWRQARQYQHAPPAARLLLGQALSAAVLLSSTIKFKGSLILQFQGNGPVRTLVAQSTHDRKIRGLVKSIDDIQSDAWSTLLGEGRLVITLSSDTAHPYQGVVSLEGIDMAAVLESYFLQSEQLNTRLWLFADDEQVSGLLLQELPAQLRNQDDWERIEMLADTLTEHEIQLLDCEEMLYRLFNQEKIRIYEEETVTFECSCSRPKIENALRFLGREELESVLIERGHIEVDCEFCNKHFQFDRIDVEQLLRTDLRTSSDSLQRH